MKSKISRLFKKDELKILWPFYFGDFIIASFLIFIPFFIVYLRGIGLSYIQLGVVVAVMSASQLIFEIPSGAIADTYGRKFSALLATLPWAVAALLLYFFKDYYIILILFAIIGVANSFESGTYEAWITDLLEKKKKRHLLHSYFAKTSAFFNLGIIISGILGTIIVAKFGLSSIWIVSSVGSFIYFFIIQIFAEDVQIINKKNSLLKSSKEVFTKTIEAIKYSKNNKTIRYLIFTSFFFFLGWAIGGDIIWQPLLVESGLNEAYLGILFSGLAFVGIIGALSSTIFVKKLKNEINFLILMTLLSTITLLSIIFFNGLLPIILIFLICGYFMHAYWPVERTFYQHHTTKKLRASINSVNSLVGSIGAIIGSLLAGILAENFGPKITIFISAFFFIPGLIFYYKIKKCKQNN